MLSCYQDGKQCRAAQEGQWLFQDWGNQKISPAEEGGLQEELLPWRHQQGGTRGLQQHLDQHHKDGYGLHVGQCCQRLPDCQ